MLKDRCGGFEGAYVVLLWHKHNADMVMWLKGMCTVVTGDAAAVCAS